jgi:outer membrane protein TolC
MITRILLWLAALLLALLAGCASVSPDGGVARVSQLSEQRTGQPVARADAGTRARVDALLAQTLTADAALQLALLNNPRIQVALAELGIADADLAQAGTLRNPRLSVGRLGASGDLENERAVLFDLGGLLTLPLRKSIERRRFEQAQLQAALLVVRLAADARRAWFDAVAAQQTLAFFEQAALAAQAGAELAQQMAKAGNWSKLDAAREQVFHAEINAQLLQARHQGLVKREALGRAMGLSGSSQAFILPERLPVLPEQLVPPKDIDTLAMQQRLDVKAATLDVEFTARSLGLTRTTRFVNVLEFGYQNRSATGVPRADGYEIELSLPLFDWGQARVRRAEATYMGSLQRAADIALRAQSQVREANSLRSTQYEFARRYRDEIVPLRKRMSDEMLLRYNGMLASEFELLSDARAQITSVSASIDAQRDFWIADSELQFAIHGGASAPVSPAALTAPPVPTGAAH